MVGMCVECKQREGLGSKSLETRGSAGTIVPTGST